MYFLYKTLLYWAQALQATMLSTRESALDMC